MQNNQERSQKMLENIVLRMIFGPLLEESKADWRKLHHHDFTICAPHQILELSNQESYDGRERD